MVYEHTNYDKDFYKSNDIDHSSFREINTKENYDLNKLIEILQKNNIASENISDFIKIRVFRNKIMHHNFLLLQYQENEIKSRITWLREHILLLKKYLPKDYQTGFLNDINKCKNKLKLEEIFMEEL